MITPSTLRGFLQPLLSKEPAHQLIRLTARKQWRLLAVNMGSGILQSFTEGFTFGVVFLAVRLLSATSGDKVQSIGKPLFNLMPALAGWINGLSSVWMFFGLLGLALILQSIQSISRYVNAVSVGYFAARCRSLVALNIHRQVLALTFPCASRYKVGDLADYINEGPEAIRIQIESINQLLLGFLLLTTYLIVLIRISLWLLIMVLLIGAAIFIIQTRLLPRIRSGSEKVSILQARILSLITEQIQGLRLLHSSGQLDVCADLAKSGMGVLEDEFKRQSRRSSVIGPLTQFLPIFAIVVISALSLYMFGGRTSGTLPSLITFVFALQKLTGQINILNQIVNSLAENTGRFKRLNDILSPLDKQYRRLGGTPFESLNHSIQFEGVGLSYPTSIAPSLVNISFRLFKGQMVALVGPSGAGKSSIADLLTGLYVPSVGQILIDDVSITEIDLSTWQQRLGVVSQDTFLFNASIAENIAFGTPWATRLQIEQASVAAQAAGFIERMPQGYDTLVGERGYRLSGGQRQRLSLARAILRNPELLILDEATSALDSASERLVQEALESFERNHTVLVIAHRLSTIVRADLILVLDGGKVIESGNHQHLLELNGVYSTMWNLQNSSATPRI